MNIEITKIDLAKKLFNINKESVLKQLKAILDKEEVVAYTTNGKPLTRVEYIKEVKDAEKEFENGDYITGEQLLKNIDKW